MKGFKNRNTDTAKANARRTELADEFALKVFNLVADFQYDLSADNLPVNYYQIAKFLNRKGYKTRFGKPWQVNSVKGVFERVRDRGLVDQD